MRNFQIGQGNIFTNVDANTKPKTHQNVYKEFRESLRNGPLCLWNMVLVCWAACSSIWSLKPGAPLSLVWWCKATFQAACFFAFMLILCIHHYWHFPVQVSKEEPFGPTSFNILNPTCFPEISSSSISTFLVKISSESSWIEWRRIKKYVTYVLTRVTDVNTEQQMCFGNCTGRPQSRQSANSLLGGLQNLSQMGLKRSLFLIAIIIIIFCCF